MATQNSWMFAISFTFICSMCSELIPCFSITTIMESRLITCSVSFVHFGIWRLCTHCGLSGSLWFFLNAPAVKVKDNSKDREPAWLWAIPTCFHYFFSSPRDLIMVEESLEVDLKFTNKTPVLRTMPGILGCSISIWGIIKHMIGPVDHAALS